ncbi:hypothetical protein HY484_04700 [Candidatus Woesearchaeota archaeon]|nr:hypothetical protein [Candidatus Woesearchaeota archaeon]
MKKMFFVVAILLLSVVSACSSNRLDPAFVGQKITVFKSESCGCCDLYVNYLEKQGFVVEVQDLLDLSDIKNKLKVPQQVRSCHVSKVNNYFVEGHVPVEAVTKLLKEKPDIAGIALPGMPSGSPGMPGAKNEDFVVFAVGKDGKITEFMRI